MRRAIVIAAVLGALVVLYGAYMFTLGSADMCADAGGSWNDLEKKCNVDCSGRPLEVQEPDGGCSLRLK